MPTLRTVDEIDLGVPQSCYQNVSPLQIIVNKSMLMHGANISGQLIKNLINPPMIVQQFTPHFSQTVEVYCPRYFLSYQRASVGNVISYFFTIGNHRRGGYANYFEELQVFPLGSHSASTHISTQVLSGALILLYVESAHKVVKKVKTPSPSQPTRKLGSSCTNLTI